MMQHMTDAICADRINELRDAAVTALIKVGATRTEAVATALAVLALQLTAGTEEPEDLIRFVEEGAQWASLWWFKGEAQ